MSDLVYCPRCKLACLEDNCHLAQCPECFYAFCGLCSASWHPGSDCMNPEARLRILQARSSGRAASEEQSRKEQDVMNEVMNLKYIRSHTMSCPSCSMAVSKVEGCNKMVCGNCGSYFCYRCGKRIQGYQHYWDGNCILFEDLGNPQPGIPARPDMALNGYFAQVANERWPERRRICPSCGQENFKVGNNNHMSCWHCRNHFCAICKAVVRNSSEHFGPKTKCKQHTA